MKKSQTLDLWRGLQAGLPILPHMTPIPYKSRGSRYGACGIRIDGNAAFVDAVLSRLKDLIDGENCLTRLELARSVVDGSGIGKQLPNADAAAEVCYIRLHVRGGEAQRMAVVFDKQLHGPTERYASALGQ